MQDFLRSDREFIYSEKKTIFNVENSSNNHDFLTPMQWIPPLIRGAQNIYKWCSTLSHLISWQKKTE